MDKPKDLCDLVQGAIPGAFGQSQGLRSLDTGAYRNRHISQRLLFDSSVLCYITIHMPDFAGWTESCAGCAYTTIEISTWTDERITEL